MLPSWLAIGCLLCAACSAAPLDGVDSGVLSADSRPVASADLAPAARWVVPASSHVLGTLWRGVWSGGPHDVWVAGLDSVLHWDGTSFTEDFGSHGHAVGGSGPDDVWIAGTNNEFCQGAAQVFHFDGTAWALSLEHQGGLCAVYGAARNDIWIAGQDQDEFSRVLRWDGTAWRDMNIVAHYLQTALWGRGPDDIWTVGGFLGANDTRPNQSGRVSHWNGAGWAPLAGGGAPYSSIWTSDTGEVWAVQQSAVSRWDRTGATSVPSMPYWSFNAVWGSASDDVWIGGSVLDGRGGSVAALFHWNGTALLEAWRGAAGTVRGLHGSGPTDVWAVGDNGLLLHYTTQ